MKTLTIDQLAEMKPQFIDWLETHWCCCKADRIEMAARGQYAVPFDDETWTNAEHHLTDGHPCNCYGRDEFDDVELATIDDNAAIIYYHGRTLTLLANRDAGPDATPYEEFLAGEPFITCGDTQWIGDDCDYYGPIVHWLASLS